MRVALLGAESTGKTQLAQALHAHTLQQGHASTWVPEVLRSWCDTHQTTPQAPQQAGIAMQQASACLSATTPWVFADTAPLLIAVYSELLFADDSLYPFALEHHRHYDLTLLMGLDMAWVPDGVQRTHAHMRAAFDARVRSALASQRIAYATVYGLGPARLENALQAIAFHQRPPTSNGTWAWQCANCSDAACEHRMFSKLLPAENRL